MQAVLSGRLGSARAALGSSRAVDLKTWDEARLATYQLVTSQEDDGAHTAVSDEEEEGPMGLSSSWSPQSVAQEIRTMSKTIRRRGSNMWSRTQDLNMSEEDEQLNNNKKTLVERATAMLFSVPFQATMGVIILANALVIGFETDMPEYRYWNSFENTFLVIFTGELSFRILALGVREFFDPSSADIAWNVFDLFIVGLGILDLGLSLLPGTSDNNNGGAHAATAFRVVRLLRILRIFRIVRFLKQLYMLAFGLALAAEAIMWVTILMLFILYVCSIILVRSVGQLSDDTPHSEFLTACFGNILVSMLTLFELMVNPYLDPYHVVFWEHPILTVFILGFVIFGSFGMIALLTGVIHENMFEKNQLRAEEHRQERDNKRKTLLKSCGLIFDELGTGGIPKERFSELDELLPKVLELFKVHGIHLVEDDLCNVIDMMDADCSGVIDKNEFCHYFLRMAEEVRPLLLLELRSDIMQFVKLQFESVKADMQDILKQTAVVSEASSAVVLQQMQEVIRQAESSASSQKETASLQQELDAVKHSILEELDTVRRSLLETMGEASSSTRKLAVENHQTTKAAMDELQVCLGRFLDPSNRGEVHSPGSPATAAALGKQLRLETTRRGAPRVAAVPVEQDNQDDYPSPSKEVRLSKEADSESGADRPSSPANRVQSAIGGSAGDSCTPMHSHIQRTSPQPGWRTQRQEAIVELLMPTNAPAGSASK